MPPKLLLTPLALVCALCSSAATAVPQQDSLEQPASHHRQNLVPDAVMVAADLTVTAAPLQPLPESSIAACVPIRDQHQDILEQVLLLLCCSPLGDATKHTPMVI